MTEKGRLDRAALLDLLPRLKRFCLVLTGRDHDADDLLQGTIERLLQKPPPPDADLAKWTFRVCRNLWIDETRSRKVRAAAPLEDAPDASAVDGERAAVAHVAFQKVRSAVDDLPEEQRVVISLVALEGYSYREAADIIDAPIGTVMSRLSRARAALAAQFGDAAAPAH